MRLLKGLNNMAIRSLEQTFQEFETRIENRDHFYAVGDLDDDILDYLKEYYHKKNELEEELLKTTSEISKTSRLAKILIELIEEKSCENAEPEMKKAELKNIGFLTCQCSECGAQFHELEYTNYCPNCGAKWSE